MRAAYLSTQGFDLRETNTPKCDDDSLLIKTLACGICEGDRYSYVDALGQALVFDEKDGILGHEGTGTVVEIGKRVTNFSPGDTVTSIDGAFAEYFSSTTSRTLKIPEGLDHTLVLGEPLACCVHGGLRYNTSLGDRAAVIGCGFMGMICVQLLRLQGAREVCAIDLIDWRLTDSLRFGATSSYNPHGKEPAEIHGDLGYFDIVIEATGTPEAIDIAQQLVAEHGRIVIVGYHQTNNGARSVNMKLWNWKAIDVVNAHVRRTEEKVAAMDVGLKLLSSGMLEIASLITKYKFENISTAFSDLASRKTGLYKASLVFS